MGKKSLGLLVGIGLLAFLTNPSTKEKFDAELHKHIDNKKGFFSSLVVKGASLLEFFKIQNCLLFSIAFLNDPNKDQPKLIGFGAFNTWVFDTKSL
ncbi:hypothetical protein CYY_003540 [Polysphondylium violaceum]|uniref:Uncharacterized protein n=1 Tax=Polysphondylium violaceum TaxID=133409 RepID=A0A8J4V050_9MYCE|nr:hypothetical protein CYY_003540 [Polysphondylium violaceum]